MIDLSWWSTPLIPAFQRQRQVDLSYFMASLVYIVSSRTTRTTWRDLIFKERVEINIVVGSKHGEGKLYSKGHQGRQGQTSKILFV